MDWNEDGKKDLILGEYDGSIRIYINTNLDEDPVFDGFTYLQAAGSKFDCGSYSVPHIVDWNSDGKKDVLCGDDIGRIWVLVNTGTNAAPSFDSTSFASNGLIPLDVGYRASPTVTDWDFDGKKDLLVSEMNGKVYFFSNTGTETNPIFASSEFLMVNGTQLDIGSTARIDLVDWDEDGILDLIAGEYNGYVYLFQAEGPLSLSSNRLFESQAVTIDLAVKAGRINKDRTYLLLGSATGTEPGMALPGGLVTLPLNWDPFTDLVMGLLNSVVFSGFYGQLDGNGTAAAQINAPMLPGQAGVLLHFAYTLNKPFDYVSNAAAIEIVP